MGGVSWWAIVAIWEHACTDQDSLQLVSCTHSCIKFTKVKLYDKAPWRFTSSSQVNGDKDGCMHGGRGFMMRCDSWCRCRSDKCVWEVVFFPWNVIRIITMKITVFFFIMSCKKDPALFWGSPVSLFLHYILLWGNDFYVTLVSSSSGSSGVVQAVFTLPLHSVVLINSGEFPLEEVTDSFWCETSKALSGYQQHLTDWTNTCILNAQHEFSSLERDSNLVLNNSRNSNVTLHVTGHCFTAHQLAKHETSIWISKYLLCVCVRQVWLTTPLMPFFPRGPLGTTTR